MSFQLGHLLTLYSWATALSKLRLFKSQSTDLTELHKDEMKKVKKLCKLQNTAKYKVIIVDEPRLLSLLDTQKS